LEILATVAILGILMAISIPPIYRSMDAQSSRQDADALAGRLRLARSQSLSSYSDVIVYFGMDGAGTYTVHVDNGGGTGIPDDEDFDITHKNNGIIDDGELVQQSVSLDGRAVFGYVEGVETSYGDNIDNAIGFAGNPPRVTFHADGTASQDGWVAIMPQDDFQNQKHGRDYLVEVSSSTGEIRVVNVGQ